MALSRIQQIKRVLKEADVRDPRGALIAIEQIVKTKNPEKKIEPAIKLEVIDHGERGELRIRTIKKLEAKHIGLAIDGLRDVAAEKLRERIEGDAGCEGCGAASPVKELLSNLFAQFEAEIAKKGGRA